MDRKKTILIAVMINAGLLAVLFIAALSSQDEMIPTEQVIATTSYPLFSEEADTVLQAASAVSSVAKAPVLTPLPVIDPSVETPSPLVVHKLPSPVPEPVTTIASALSMPISISSSKIDSFDGV